MRRTLITIAAIAIALVAVSYLVYRLSRPAGEPPVETDLIRVDEPRPDDLVESPLTVRGEARGTWYFEGSFPVVLVNWDGLIIADGHARAQGEWMTEELVPFRAELEFTSPSERGDPEFMERGTLILQRANPSGLPENDDAVEVTVRFAP